MSSAPFSAVSETVRDRVGNDPIFALFAEATQRAAAGESILNATLGALITDEMKLAVMPTVIDAFQRAVGPGSAGYAPISGAPAYRAAVIQDLYGGTELVDQTVAVATPGGTGAVFEAVVNFLQSGQKMLTPDYWWGPYTIICDHAGRGHDTFRMFADDGSFDLDAMADGMERHARDQGRVLVVLNFPCHNPTGYSLSPTEWEGVADVVERVGNRVPVTVLVDAAYRHFGGEAATTWVDVVPRLLESSTVLVAWTASKSMCQYGSRIGALVASHRDEGERDQIANALGYSCRATWSNCNHLGQIAVTELITDPALKAASDAERDALTSLLQERIDAFNAAAGEAGLQTPRFDAGFFVAVFTPDEEATAARMRELGVYVTPLRGAVRVALCSTPVAVIPRLVDALAEGVAAAG